MRPMFTTERRSAMADVRAPNVDNRNNSQGTISLEGQLRILCEEAEALCMDDRYDHERAALLKMLALAFSVAGISETLSRARIRDIVSCIALMSHDEQERASELKRLQGIIDRIAGLHEKELAETREQRDEALSTARQMEAEHRVELGSMREQLNIEIRLLNAQLDKATRAKSAHGGAGEIVEKGIRLEKEVQLLRYELKNAHNSRSPRKEAKKTKEDELSPVAGAEVDDGAASSATIDALQNKLKSSERRRDKERLEKIEANVAAQLYKTEAERANAKLQLMEEELRLIRKHAEHK